MYVDRYFAGNLKKVFSLSKRRKSFKTYEKSYILCKDLNTIGLRIFMIQPTKDIEYKKIKRL